MKYRKKPVIVEAEQYTGENNPFDALFPAYKTPKGDIGIGRQAYAMPIMAINTLEGRLEAKVGSWIIKGIKGEFYPCDNEIFEATYEKVENE